MKAYEDGDGGENAKKTRVDDTQERRLRRLEDGLENRNEYQEQTKDGGFSKPENRGRRTGPCGIPTSILDGASLNPPTEYPVPL